MSKETKFEEMQRRLHLDKMEAGEKKSMMSKLQKAGGQVVNLDTGRKEESKKLGNIARETSSTRVLETRKAGKESPQKNTERPQTEKKEEAPKVKAPVKTVARPRQDLLPYPSQKPPNFFSVFAHRLNCSLSWIFDFGARHFRERYIRFVCREYQNALASISNALNPLYNGDIHAIEFRKNLYNTGRLAEYELGYHMCKLFQNEHFTRIQVHISRGVFSSEESFKILYRELYYLKAHANHCKVAVPMLLRTYAVLFPKKVGKDFSHTKASQALSFVWDQFFLETHSLILYYWANFCWKNKQELSIEQYLGISENRPPVGFMAEEVQAMMGAQILNQSFNEEDSGDSYEETGVPEEIQFPSKDIKEGIDFIHHKIDFLSMYENFRAGRDLRALFDLDDKLFYAYCILDYFDSEFTFLWAGSYINFYVLTESNGGRYDPKKELILLNGRLNHFYEQTNEYLRQLRAYKDLAKASVGGGSQRIIQMENKGKDLSRLSFAARKILIKLLEDYLEQLHRILASKGQEEGTVGNWEEKIGVSVKAGRKFLSDITIEEALRHTYSLLAAAEWLLSKSDLSGMGVGLISPRVIPYDTYLSLTGGGAGNK